MLQGASLVDPVRICKLRVAYLAGRGPLEAIAIVKGICVDVTQYLPLAAASSVRSHLRKLKRNGHAVDY